MSTKEQLFHAERKTAEAEIDRQAMVEFDALPYKARLGRVVADVSTLVFSALGTNGSAADIVPVGGLYHSVWVEAVDDGLNVTVKAVYSTDASVAPYTALLESNKDFSVQVNNFARLLIVAN